MQMTSLFTKQVKPLETQLEAYNSQLTALIDGLQTKVLKYQRLKLQQLPSDGETDKTNGNQNYLLIIEGYKTRTKQDSLDYFWTKN